MWEIRWKFIEIADSDIDVGLRICIIGPIQTATLRKITSVSLRHKSVDNYLIINALMMNQYSIFIRKRFRNLGAKNLFRFRPNLLRQGKDLT